ncbi:MAG: methyltransferase domain-containing protein [Chloroflexota bacterium]
MSEHEHEHQHRHQHVGHEKHGHGDEHGKHEHGGRGHGHGGHEHGYYADSLHNNDLLYAPVYRQVVDWLAIAPGAQAMEAGSGAGGFTVVLAQAVGPDGQVTALDANEQLLGVARDSVEKAGLGARVRYAAGDLAALPFPDGSFDLTWSSRTVHHLADQVGALRELARVLRPGGRLALREGGMRPNFLPDDVGIGAPGLNDRIHAAHSAWFGANVRGEGATRYPYGWLHALREAGLKDVGARTFLLEATAPFTDAQVKYMARQLKRWTEDGERRHYINKDDMATLTQLADPASDHYVFGRDDLHLVETVSIYVGTR